MVDYHEYIGDNVKVIDKDGDITEGIAISYDVGIDEDMEYDTLGIQVKEGSCVGIPIPDIVSIERVIQ